MFKILLRNLDKAYTGKEIYIPDAIYPLIKEWMEKTYFHHRVKPSANLKWNGKTLVPYDEEDVLKSYQSCPIHLPERILEKSIVIEASLMEVAPEPVREEKKKERPKPQVKVSTYKPEKRRPSFL
ncbi:MAG: hypothetical protein ACW99G_22375 [Candidatus Thorarchaeota archaeon]